MADLVRHGPYPTQAAARAVAEADPRPQRWLAAQGAYTVGHVDRPHEWWAFLPPADVKPEGEGMRVTVTVERG